MAVITAKAGGATVTMDSPSECLRRRLLERSAPAVAKVVEVQTLRTFDEVVQGWPARGEGPDATGESLAGWRKSFQRDRLRAAGEVRNDVPHVPDVRPVILGRQLAVDVLLFGPVQRARVPYLEALDRAVHRG